MMFFNVPARFYFNDGTWIELYAPIEGGMFYQIHAIAMGWAE